MSKKVHNIKAWIEACRLRTLPLSLSCILMGTFLSAAGGFFDVGIFIFSVLTTVFLQVLSNLANDYGDSIHGADSTQRQGPSRAVQKGDISKSQMKSAIKLLSILSFASGISLLYLALKDELILLTIFLGLGLLSIWAAISYTAGKKPYGYRGFGDLAVLIFFGFIGVGGTYFLQAGEIRMEILLPAASCGLFATGVLNINNIRDIDSDKLAGKISIPVRLGRNGAVRYHWLILAAGWLFASSFVLIQYQQYFQWLFLITLPLFLINARAVYLKTTPSEIDPYLKQLALATLFFVLTFGIGLILAIQ